MSLLSDAISLNKLKYVSVLGKAINSGSFPEIFYVNVYLFLFLLIPFKQNVIYSQST